jgi:hypothetical protein
LVWWELGERCRGVGMRDWEFNSTWLEFISFAYAQPNAIAKTSLYRVYNILHGCYISVGAVPSLLGSALGSDTDQTVSRALPC